MEATRKIIHIDMDAFYASVEQRDRPELRGKPVIVGGDPAKRGVVAACSYEARRFGIHSAMPGKTAFRRCPHAVFLRPRFDVYRSVSSQIRDIFYEYTDLVEPLSLDEAFLDVTRNKSREPSATRLAEEIRRRIFHETRLTASAGVSFNKFLAKVASDENKPDGITVIEPGKAAEFIDGLPVRKFFGVGKATEKRMLKLGIKTGADLKQYRREDLILFFGKSGNYFFETAHAIDRRPVVSHRIRKSLGKETTLNEDIDDTGQMLSILSAIAERLEAMVHEKGISGKTLTLKIKYGNFQSITRSITRSDPFLNADAMMNHTRRLLWSTEAGSRKVRLLGLTISNFYEKNSHAVHCQLPLPFCDAFRSEEACGRL